MSEIKKSKLEPLAINSLLDKQFYIPHYQRGYRWTDLQVKQLLEDIDSFLPREIEGKSGERTFYCLQPVVVKKIGEDFKQEKGLKGEWYELIDGQQRITTIYLIIQYINDRWVKQKKDQFKINFETREGCVEFLANIHVKDDEKSVEIDRRNIDFYHISSAYQSIRDWELTYEQKYKERLNDAEFQSKLLAYCKVIWYEVEKQDGRALFERLNLGKIPLTNAELTKALFLSSESFNTLSSAEQKTKQLEIARLWDEMEHALNEPDLKFWSFITNKKRDSFETKIELILDMISEKPEGEKDPLFTFLSFTTKQKEVNLTKVWLEIEQFYYTLKEWFKDRNLYHKIGFLIAAKTFGKVKETSLANLVKESMRQKKSEFEKVVDAKIMEKVKVEISELRYSDHPNQIFNVLLLFNVETNRTSDAISEFYPFKQHKANTWSLEHIHARQSEHLDSTKREPWTKWLDMHLKVLEEIKGNNTPEFDRIQVQNLISEIKQYNTLQLTWERFKDLFKKVNDLFTIDEESMDRESEGLSNLALLSQPDNAALNNSVFELKKREIIKLDRNGSFIPICTRRAFLKYYDENGSSTQYFFWSKEDRDIYFKTISNKLNNYLTINTIVEDGDKDKDK